MQETIVKTKKITISTENQKFSAHYFKPESEGKYSAIILLTEIWGINENILDVAERLKEQGYIVLLPDLLSETGIPKKLNLQLFKDLKNPETREEATKRAKELFAPIRNSEFEKETIKKLQTCLNYLESKENIGDVGVMGFSFGGYYSYLLAINPPEVKEGFIIREQLKIKACVSFYGRNPTELEDIKKLNCPVLVFHGEYDEPALKNFPEFAKIMEELGKDFQYFIYPKTKHSFFNDKNPKVYNKEATEDSRKKTIDFFGEHLN
jgi:carboxymethylenebutenolidase|tara:strand:+ start:441 stop:1235 length:795 start_codon:yes stop_codon:yes gene_type:complete